MRINESHEMQVFYLLFFLYFFFHTTLMHLITVMEE